MNLMGIFRRREHQDTNPQAPEFSLEPTGIRIDPVGGPLPDLFAFDAEIIEKMRAHIAEHGLYVGPFYSPCRAPDGVLFQGIVLDDVVINKLDE